MQFRRRSSLTILVTAAALLSKSTAAPTTYASCSCGYEDDQHRVWRESIASDFSSGDAVATAKKNWAVQTNTWESSPLARTNEAANVFQGSGALSLKTSAYDNSGTTQVSEIDTQRGDILYGTFRMTAIIPTVPGVVFGFFSYNGTVENGETDIEFRSSDSNSQNTVHYSSQPDETMAVTVSGARFDTTYGEHRFDWLPTATNYYYNQTLQGSITKDVPALGSQIIANVWSDGNNWTSGPPTSDATAYVKGTRLYFNSTSYTATQFNAQCKASRQFTPCSI